MTKEQEKIALKIVDFIIEHGISVYSNMVSIPIKENEDIEFQNLIGAFNYCGSLDVASKRLPVIVQNDEHLGRLFVQYTNHNFVSGYRSLETNEVFQIGDDRHLSASGDTIKESLLALYKIVEENLSKFTSVTYSEDNELNSL